MRRWDRSEVNGQNTEERRVKMNWVGGRERKGTVERDKQRDERGKDVGQIAQGVKGAGYTHGSNLHCPPQIAQYT